MSYLVQNFLIKQSRGFSLVETLLFSGIVSVVLLGTLKLMGISAQSVKVNKISHVEDELESLIRKGIMAESDCRKNLDFSKIQGGTPLQAKGEITELKRGISGGDVLLLSAGQNIEDSLEIVKMELAGTAHISHPSGQAVERFFTVYYKKLGAGALNTLGGGTRCSSSDVRDCYFKTYKLMYRIERISGVDTTTECAVSVCTQGACCYTVDRIDETLPIEDLLANVNGRSVIGCRGTSSIKKSRTVGLGFMAGVNNTSGDSNVFMGYSAGYHNTTMSSPEGSRNIHIGAQRKRFNTPPPMDDTGYSNIFIGAYAGRNNTSGHQNIFFGFSAGENNTEGNNNIFIGPQTGLSHTVGEGNTFIGDSAGQNVGGVSDGNPPPPPVHGNTYIGNMAGIGRGIIPNNPQFILYNLMPTTHSNIGQYNTFVGESAGSKNTYGNHNIYIGKGTGSMLGTPPPADITDAGDFQLNIGHLILGRIPDPLSSPHPLNSSPDIPSNPGVVINGNLKVRGSIRYDYENTSGGKPIANPPPPSSRVYKKNIKSFKSYGKALEDIVNTPLFTYKYKKDRSKKNRMGVISEELPKSLQLGKSEDTKISMPDWPSIYGTFWASIKTLYVQFKGFREKVLVELKRIKNILNRLLKVTEGNKNHLVVLSTQFKEAVEISQKDQQKKQFIQFKKSLETTKSELRAMRQELQKWKYDIKTGATK